MAPSGFEGVARKPVLMPSFQCLWRPSDLLILLLQNGVCITPAEVSMNMESVCGKWQSSLLHALLLGLGPALVLREGVM